MIICSAEGEVVLPKDSPRNVTFWSFRQSAWEAPRDTWKPRSWLGKTSELLVGALSQGCSPLGDFICSQPINGSHLFKIWAGWTSTFNFGNLRDQMLNCSFRIHPGISCSPVQWFRQSYLTMRKVVVSLVVSTRHSLLQVRPIDQKHKHPPGEMQTLGLHPRSIESESAVQQDRC